MYTASQLGYPISVIDMAYPDPPGPQETMQMFTNRLYGVLLTMTTTVSFTNELRIARKYTGIA